MNQVVEVGRVCSEVELKKSSTGKSFATVEIAVQRNFKNAEGEYETDIIPFVVFDKTAENVAEFVSTGDTVGVKGRLARTDKNKPLEFIADKVTFLTSKKKEA